MRAPPPALTDRLRAAIALAQAIHGRQRRPGTEIPYLSHLLIVTGLVLEDGGDEDQAVAAMLHDSVEDGGGRSVLGGIATIFGARVAEIVEGCSDTVDGHPNGRWIERKRRYLAHLQTVDDDAVLRVALADKLHNANSILRAYRHQGQALWKGFGDRSDAEEVWYYGHLLELFERRRPGPLTEDLRRALSELVWLMAREPAAESAGSPPPVLRRRCAGVMGPLASGQATARRRAHGGLDP